MPKSLKNATNLLGKIKLSSLARRYVQKHGIDPVAIQGSGPGKRIMATDVLQYLELPKTSFPSEDPVCLAEEIPNVPFSRLSIPVSLKALNPVKNYLNKNSQPAQEYNLDDFIIRACIKALIKTPPLEYPHNSLSDSLSFNLIESQNTFKQLTHLNSFSLLALSKQRQSLPVQVISDATASMSYIQDSDISIESIADLPIPTQILVIAPQYNVTDAQDITVNLYFNPEIILHNKVQILAKEIKTLLETPSLFLL